MEIDLGATTGGKDFGNVGGVCDAEIARGAGAGLCDTTVWASGFVAMVTEPGDRGDESGDDCLGDSCGFTTDEEGRDCLADSLGFSTSGTETQFAKSL